jgi:hypothetical protein
MRLFALHPDQVLPRTSSEIRLPSLAFCIVYGAVSLGLVSTAAYSIWAFHLLREGPALYIAIAGVYLLFGGLALSRLVLGRATTAGFAALFATAFLAYAVLWCAVYFGLGRKYFADLWAALVGLLPVVLLFRAAFGTKSPGWLPLFLALFAFHSTGYYLGNYLSTAIRGTNGQLLWGAAHGVGFGAGLGFLLFHAQSRLKKRLSAAFAA